MGNNKIQCTSVLRFVHLANKLKTCEMVANNEKMLIG